MIRRTIMPVTLAVAVTGCAWDEVLLPALQQNDASQAVIQAAIESDERSEDMVARDTSRRPDEILRLSGVGPGDQVVELGSFGLYYSTILSAVVGSEGMLDMFDPPRADGFGGDAARAFVAMHGNAEYHVVDYAAAGFPQDVDVVFNILFYHDLMPWGFETAALNTKLFDALKPGGVYLIVDHKAEDGSGWRDAGTIHRMGIETIVEEVTAAGFELAAQSEVLAHPDDDRTSHVFQMRGETDRAVMVFIKPE